MNSSWSVGRLICSKYAMVGIIRDGSDIIIVMMTIVTNVYKVSFSDAFLDEITVDASHSCDS